MKRLRNMSIIWKLNSLIAAISAVVLLLASTVFVLQYRHEYKNTMSAEAEALAAVVGFSCAPALLFDDHAAAAQSLFVLEDWHNFGADYDKTLMAWFANFNRHWPELAANYSERFYRMWKYYLLSCAGGFRARYLQLWQIVFSKGGIPGGYRSVR